MYGFKLGLISCLQGGFFLSLPSSSKSVYSSFLISVLPIKEKRIRPARSQEKGAEFS